MPDYNYNIFASAAMLADYFSEAYIKPESTYSGVIYRVLMENPRYVVLVNRYSKYKQARMQLKELFRYASQYPGGINLQFPETAIIKKK